MLSLAVPGCYVIAGICAYAAVAHMSAALRQPRQPAQQVFALACVMAVFMLLTLAGLFQSSDIAELSGMLRWNIACVLGFEILYLWFTVLYSGVRSARLAVVFGVLLGVLLVRNFVAPYTLQFAHMDVVRQQWLPWGEVLSRESGVPSGWAYATAVLFPLALGYQVKIFWDLYRRHFRLADRVMLITASIYAITSTEGVFARLFPDLALVPAGALGFVGLIAGTAWALDRNIRMSLRSAEARFRSLVEQAPFSVQVLARDGSTRMINRAWEELWQVSGKSLVGYNIFENKKLAERGITTLIAQAFAGEVSQAEPFVYVPSGQQPPADPSRERWVQGYMYPLKDGSGNIREVVLMHRDVTEDRRLADSLRASEERFRTVIEQSPVGMAFHRNGLTLKVNATFLRMLGYDDPAEVCDKSMLLWIAPQCREDVAARLSRRPSDEAVDDTYETQFQRKDGSQFPVLIYAKSVMISEGQLSFGFMIDLTERKDSDDRIKYLAYYDSTTDLPNRQLLANQLKHAMSSSVRTGQWSALLFIDLDNFKALNESQGHDIGDLLLREIAGRLTATARQGDTVARFGGDEFLVLLEDLGEQDLEAAEMARNIGASLLAELAQPCFFGTQEYRGTTSIGVTLFRGLDQSVDEILKQGDIAMYQAKNAGRNTLCFYDKAMQHAIHARSTMEAELRKAMEADQLCLHYQIQVDRYGQPMGAEALMRWMHPQRGMISPAEFIPLAEETGLMIPMGRWAMEQVCQQIAEWQRHPAMRDLVVAVNVSARQFSHPDFPAQVKHAIQTHAIAPRLLKLELTESLLLESNQTSMATMATLSDIGVPLSLDDFGTGYSSLQYLKSLPFRQLKIDQSFVREIHSSNSDRAIVRTIIGMAQSLGLDVIAEGVETTIQRDLLIEAGCRQFQGYLFGRPMPVDKFEADIHTRHTL
ncbi:EAL domain-containing protein [Rhodanobacter sp. AS-Z3]|uniref:putative bifunctional diguanylate cyclase/phosphodiesterase n=1 Tax=Rhodanobacter sp. AS-Z3 TaxID=3031330 RepID=UPI002478EC60|nr:EAL domain-containing protein [Rhodanobacter sp. AS-Z3]WEN15565.1 EAL domain-containing protein [Rhodanobacter sp. AS-Z3]